MEKFALTILWDNELKDNVTVKNSHEICPNCKSSVLVYEEVEPYLGEPKDYFCTGCRIVFHPPFIQRYNSSTITGKI